MPTTIAHRSPFNVPRWTETQAREVIAALDRSGKPVSVFAAEHALDPQRIYQWRRRVAGSDPTMFREIVVRPSDPGGPGSSFEVVLATGDIVRVPPSFDATALARLLDVLIRARTC